MFSDLCSTVIQLQFFSLSSISAGEYKTSIPQHMGNFFQLSICPCTKDIELRLARMTLNFLTDHIYLQHPLIHQIKVMVLKTSNHFINLMIIIIKFPLAPIGVLAPGSEHARPSARPPIDTSVNFPAHVSAESPSNISPNPSEVIFEVSEPYDNFF